MQFNERIPVLGQPPKHDAHRLNRARDNAEFCLALGRILFPEAQNVIPRQLVPLWNESQRVLRRGTEKGPAPPN